MHARRHRMVQVQNRGIISDIFGGEPTLPTLSLPPIIPQPTKTSASEPQSSSSSSSSDVTSSTESTSSSATSSSSLSSSTSQAPSSTPLPVSTTIEQTAPNSSTRTVIVQASESQTPSAGYSGGATGFLNDKVASGIVFAIVGLIGLIVILTILTLSIRARRKSRLHQEAVSFEPTIGTDTLDDHGNEKERRLTPSPRNSNDRDYYQQTSAAFQRPGYDFGIPNRSQLYPEGPTFPPSALYSTELARDVHPGSGRNPGVAGSSPMQK